MSISREDLIRLLREDPTLLEELRALVLTKDLLELPVRTGTSTARFVVSPAGKEVTAG